MRRSLIPSSTPATVVAALLLAGCAPGTPNPNSGAVVALVPARELRMSTDKDYDVRRVDPAFTAALAAYAAELRRLPYLPEGELDMGVRRALRLLALAVERIPGAPEDQAVPVAVQVIRTAEAHMALSSPAEQAYGNEFVHALDVTATVLADLARGPYRASPLVVGRAVALDGLITRNDDPERLRRRPDELIDALTQAGLVLTAMHAAVARGVVVAAEGPP